MLSRTSTRPAACARLASFALVTFVALCTAAAAEDWTLPRNNNQQTSVSTEPVSLPLSLAWQYITAPAPGNTSQPICVGGTVVFAVGDRVIALDTTTGARKWAYPSDAPMGTQIKSSLAYFDGKVYFGANDGNLYCISLGTGKLLWAYATQGPIRSSPMIVDGRVYIGSDDNGLHCVDASTGEGLWRGPFLTRDDVAATPSVEAGLVYFMSRDTHLYVANAQTGLYRWSFRFSVSTVNTVPVIGNDTLYLNADNLLYALAARSGIRKWVLTFPAEVSASPAFADQVLYVPLKNRKLYAITSQGKALWPQPADTVYAVRTAPLVIGNLVFVAADKGVVSAYDTATGALKWRYVLFPTSLPEQKGVVNNDITASLIYSNGTLFVLPADGTLSAFRFEAPDSDPPAAYYFTPSPSLRVNGSPPLKFSAVLFDSGSGVDESSISLSMDGEGVEHTYEAATGTVSYTTPITENQIPLADGRHSLVLSARDWKGNSMRQEWSFVVDNTLPKPRVRSIKPAERRTRPSRSQPAPGGETRPAPGDGGGQPLAPPPPPPMPGPAGPAGAGATEAPQERPDGFAGRGDGRWRGRRDGEEQAY